MYGQELLQMMKNFIDKKIEAEPFSFDFPGRLAFVYKDFRKENPALCDFLQKDMPDYCAAYDPDPAGEPDLLDDEQLREKVKGVYEKAVALQK